MAWNVFQHFYPYFDVVEVDWDAVLTRTLRRALTDQSSEAFLRTLRRMVAQLDDGHGNVMHPSEPPRYARPFRVTRVDSQVVVTDVVESMGLGHESCAKPGDVVVSIDEVRAEKELRIIKQYISGSPQFKETLALHRFGQGKPGTFVPVVLLRKGQQVECRIYRNFDDNLIQEERPHPIQEIQRSIYYVDLTRAEWDAIKRRLNDLAQADGVVFDCRGYPKVDNYNILRHLSDRPLRSARWQIPEIIYPDHQNVAGYDTTGRWRLTPRAPQILGEIAFLTDARAISQAETIMGIVEHYELGTIVGQPTAGTNGNVNPFTLPSGYEVSWTGMRVVKHDGAQHHLIGIQPTVPISPTLRGIREGRDEAFEKAIELIQE